MKIFTTLPLLALAQKSEECNGECQRAISKQFRSKTANLAWNLLFSSGDSADNKIISPLSIISSIYMLGAGAGGETRDQLLSALVDLSDVRNEDVRNLSKDEFFNRFFEMENFLSDSANQYTLDIANGVFANENILLDSYQETLEKYFIEDKKPVSVVDFAHQSQNATELINSWISDKTHGKIAEMYSETIDSNTLIMLVSSLYFKASWANKFTPMEEIKDQHEQASACWPASFENTEVCNEDVEFMTVKDDGRFARLDDMDFVELPMKSSEGPISVQGRDFINKMTFQIWLPRYEDIRNPEADERMKQAILDNVPKIRSMEGTNRLQKLKLTIPKFSIDFDEDVKELMSKNGLDQIFSQDKDLTPMVGEENNENIEISEVKHKVAFDLDEKGIEGAATTVHQISFRSMSQPTPVTVTRPFYFAVVSSCYDKSSTRSKKKGCPYSNIPVFIGKVAEPMVRK